MTEPISSSAFSAIQAGRSPYPYGVSRVVGLSFLAEVCVDRVIARLQTSGKRHGLPAN